jgi:hypothetical protein
VVAAYSPERVPTKSESLPYWSRRCKHCRQLSESQFGRSMPVPSFGDILAPAIESNGVLELHGELRCGDKSGGGRE